MRRILLLAIALLAFAASGRAQTPTWHGIPIRADVTGPQCLVEHNPDAKGFWDCANVPFTFDYLHSHDVIIWRPKQYAIKPVGKEWYFWQISSAALAVADEENTQRFLHSPECHAPNVVCRELNPMLGHTRGQAYAVLGAYNALSVWAAHKQRKHELLREQVGLPPWNKGFWSHVYEYRTLSVVQDIWHIAGIAATN